MIGSFDLKESQEIPHINGISHPEENLEEIKKKFKSGVYL